MEKQRQGRPGANQRQVQWGNDFANRRQIRTDDLRGDAYPDTDPPYQLDLEDGKAHSVQRHTHEGIWKAGKVLSTTDKMVAVFASQAALEDAINAMPTRRRAWYGVGGGRYDADLGGVHYQGSLLGDTMSLFSCYPSAGKQYDMNLLNRLLLTNPCKSSQEFWANAEELSELTKTLAQSSGYPMRASEQVKGALDRLRLEAEQALAAGALPAAREAITRFKRTWADEVARVEQLGKLMTETRSALNTAIANKDVQACKLLYDEMMSIDGGFISPVAREKLLELGIAGVQ